MAKFKTYEKYAYSDYFKAELPAEWMEKRLSYISAYDKNSFVDGPFGSDLKSSDYKESGVPLIQLNNIRDGKHILQNYKFITEKKRVELSRHVAVPNDIVIAKMAEPVARSAIVSDNYPEYVIVADCVKLSPDLSLINLSFLNWAINSDLVKMNAELVSSGTTRIRISLGELKKLKIPYPILIEQQAIANFLDYETAQIDTLIEKQQTLIQLLKEKRQAVISHAVTKGLNPDAPMKDSGVEWLGEVPEHWEVGRLKNVLRIRNGRDYKEVEVESGGYPVYGSGGIFKRSSDYLFDGESVLFGRKGTVDKPLLVSGKFWTVDTMFYSEVFSNAKPNYIYHQALLFPFDQLSTNTALPSMTQENLLELGFVIPPFDEQEQICQYLSDKLKVFLNLVSKAEQAIQLMQERRTALISAAVTGKIDVRGWRVPD